MTQKEIIEEIKGLARRNLEITQAITELYKKLEENDVNKVESQAVKESLTIEEKNLTTKNSLVVPIIRDSRIVQPEQETFMVVDPAGGC